MERLRNLANLPGAVVDMNRKLDNNLEAVIVIRQSLKSIETKLQKM